MKFNHLNVPDHWQHYWSRYPEGYTILEALISWVNQVDGMIDNQNKLNDNVEQFRKEIDDFVGRFDKSLQYEVTQTLKEWQASGFIDVVISEALQWQLDDHITTFEQRTSATVTLEELGADPTGSLDCTAILNEAILNGKRIEAGVGTFRIEGVVDFSKAPLNSYVLEGTGETTEFQLVGPTATFYDDYGNQDGRHYHTKAMKNFMLRGDGTNTALNFQSLQMNAENVTIFGFHTGLKITSDGYGSSFNGFKFQANIIDIDLYSDANTIYITNLNIDGHSDTTEACIKLNGSCSFLKIHGLIQSTKAPAIWFTETFSGNVNIELYTELAGDRANNLLAVRNDSNSDNVHVVWENSIFGYGESVRVTGEYDLGKKPSVLNSFVASDLTGSEVIHFSDCTFNYKGTNQLAIPSIFSGLNRLGSVWGGGGDVGFGAQLTPKVNQTITNTILNAIADPFCETGTNISTLGVDKPTLTHDTTTTFGSFNSAKVDFVDGVIGSASNNKLVLNYGEQVVNPGNLFVASFLIKANQSAEMKARFTGDRVFVDMPFNVDEKWRKFVFIGKNFNADTRRLWSNIFPNKVYNGLSVNITGVCVYRNVSNDAGLISDILSGQLNY